LIAYFHCIGHNNQSLKYFSNREKRYTDHDGVSSIDNAKLEEIRKNYPIKEFLLIAPELFILDSICPFDLVVYHSNDEVRERILNGELKFIKGMLRPPTHVTIGLVIEKDDKLFFINKEEAKEIYTPLDTKEKALAFLCLLEEATPIFDLSFLYEIPKDSLNINYWYIKEGLKPTQIIEEKDYYLINLFLWDVWTFDEILYKIDKDGNIEIIKEEVAFAPFNTPVF